MLPTIKAGLRLFACLAALTGLAYPLLVTGIVQLAFPVQANGSLVIAQDGSLAGSTQIGQDFSQPGYFWGRLSATGNQPYNASASGGSNLSVLNERLPDQAQARIDALRAADPDNILPIPVDLVTASGSGLDPDISPAAAYYQVARVARARGLPEASIHDLIDQHTKRPFLGLIGEARVNVLMLNLALDALQYR